jgi:hypothetical protein
VAYGNGEGGLTGGFNLEALDNTIRVLLLRYVKVKLTHNMIRVGNCQDGILANCNNLKKTQTRENMFRTLNSNIENYQRIVYAYRDGLREVQSLQVDGRLLNNFCTCAKLERVTIQITFPCSRPCTLNLGGFIFDRGGNKNNVLSILLLRLRNLKDSKS